MTKACDIIIIGGGIIGSAAAYYLAERGVRATVLERTEIGHGGSCRNGGGVRQSARDPREMPLALYAVNRLWPHLNDLLGADVEYCCRGNLRLGLTEGHRGILEKLVREGSAHGLALRMLDGREAREICPYISEAVTSASWCPTDGHANPLRATLSFYKRARELGAEFIIGEEVVALRKLRGKISQVITPRNVYESDRVILAAGWDSRAIARTVGIDIPMNREFSEVMVTEAFAPMFPQMLGTAPADFYGHQSRHGSFVFGGTSELEPFDSDYPSAVTHPVTIPGVARGVLRYFPVLKNAKVLRTWSGWRDMCADHIPVISHVEEVPGLILACAFTGHGFGIAPAVGLILSQMATGEEPALPVDAFRYDRFHAKS